MDSPAPDPSAPPIPPSAGPTPSPVPPPDDQPAENELTLDPNLSSKARGDNAAKPGDTFETTITVRVNDEGSYDVIDIDPFRVVDNPTGPVNDPSVLSDDDEEKVLGYKRPKKSMSFPTMG